MTLSIWILFALIAAVLLWFYRKKHLQKAQQNAILKVKKTKTYSLSETEKLISELKSSSSTETDVNGLNHSENRTEKVESAEFHQNTTEPPKNQSTDYIVGSFILEKKKKK